MNFAQCAFRRIALVLAVLSLCVFSLVGAEEGEKTQQEKQENLWVVGLKEQRHKDMPELIHTESLVLAEPHFKGEYCWHPNFGKNHYYIGQRVFEQSTGFCIGTLAIPASMYESPVISNPVQGVAVIAKGCKLYFIDEEANTVSFLKELPTSRMLKTEGVEKKLKFNCWVPLYAGREKIVVFGYGYKDDSKSILFSLFELPIVSGRAGELKYIDCNTERYYPMSQISPIVGTPVVDDEEREKPGGDYDYNTGMKYRVRCCDFRAKDCTVELLEELGLAWCDAERSTYLFSSVNIIEDTDQVTHEDVLRVTARLVDAKTKKTLLEYNAIEWWEMKGFPGPDMTINTPSVYWGEVAYLKANCDDKGCFCVWGYNGGYSDDLSRMKHDEGVMIANGYLCEIEVENGTVKVTPRKLEPFVKVENAWGGRCLVRKDNLIFPYQISFNFECNDALNMWRIREKAAEECATNDFQGLVTPAFPDDSYFVLGAGGMLKKYSTETYDPCTYIGLKFRNVDEMKYLWKSNTLLLRAYPTRYSNSADKVYRYRRIDVGHLSKEKEKPGEWLVETSELKKEFEEYSFCANVPREIMDKLPERKHPIKILGCSQGVLYFVEIEKKKQTLYTFDGNEIEQKFETEGAILGTLGLKNEFVVVHSWKEGGYYICKDGISRLFELPKGYELFEYSFDGDILLERTDTYATDLIDTRNAMFYSSREWGKNDWDYTPIFLALDGIGLSRGYANSFEYLDTYRLKKGKLENGGRIYNWLYYLQSLCTK